MIKELRSLLLGHWLTLGRHQSIPAPGVYIIACPQDGTNLEGKPINLSDIIYVGQSMNVRDRLNKFNNSAISGRKGHVAGQRLFNTPLRVRSPIYFHAFAPQSGGRQTKATQLRLIGDVIRLENYAIAEIIDQIVDIPWLNKQAGGALDPREFSLS